MSTVPSNRELVEGRVTRFFAAIKKWFPDEYEHALRLVSKLDHENWSETANERLAERDRLNNTPRGHS